jgi:tetratricopeptide (TPR) repeat protein
MNRLLNRLLSSRLLSGPGRRRWAKPLQIAGAVLLVAGLQAWGFNRQVTPMISVANDQLISLQQEVPDNRLMNLALQSLQDYWNSADDELTRRQILELRDSVLQRFGADPAAAVHDFDRVIGGFESRSVAEQEALATLRPIVAQLNAMYTDHFGDVIMAVSYPAWYLQPTASLLNNNRATNRTLAFNHALYLMHSRDTSAAVETLDELRRDSDEAAGLDPLISRVLFVLARMQYEAYRIEKDQGYYREAVQYAQQSVRGDADYPPAKLFLDYLLSIDRQATEVDVSPLEGEGSGEGEGERGAIATEAGEF